MAVYKHSDILRFWAKVDRKGPDDCWQWLGALFQDSGYGQFRIPANNLRAHRVCWEISYGAQIPQGMHICHTCDNPPCVNPGHLFVGTNNENVADKIQKGRQPIGTAHGQSKLTNDQIKVIRASTKTWTELMREFGVCRSTIWRVVRRVNWKHL